VSGRATAPIAALLVGLLAIVAHWFPPPLSGLLAYAGLGLLPGLGVANLIAEGWSLGARFTLGLALSPLVATAAAVPLMRAGVELRSSASVAVAVGVILIAAAELVRRRSPGMPPAESHRRADAPDLHGTPDGAFVLLWSLALAAVVAIPPLVNRYVPVRGDAWVHAGIIWDIVHHGVPPEDPRFAGLTLNYVWFFNAFVALLVRLSGDGPFFFMPLFNVVQAGLTASLAYRIGLAIWRDRGAARGTVVLVVLGFNAAMWLLWPLGFIRPMVGSVRGGHEVFEYLHSVRFPSAEIIFSLGAPYATMVNFFDKLLTGTALHHAYVLMMVHLWALLLWIQERRAESLVLAAAAAAGMLFFHGVVGLSVVPVALAVLAALVVARATWRWLPSAGALVGFGVATGVGALVALPYTLSISRGWAHERSGLEHSYLRLDGPMPWTLLTACALGWWLARGPIRRAFAERLAAPATALAVVLGLSAFALVVRLPGGNETKFVFEAFVPLAALAGAAWPAASSAWTRRLGRAGAAALFTIVFLVNPVLSVAGFALDPGARTRAELNPRPGEETLYRWIREQTPAEAVFVDVAFRDLIMVKGQRRLYLGTFNGPEKAAFPLNELIRRRRLVADLYGREQAWDEHRAELLALDRPVYVLFRPEDSPARRPWLPLESDGSSSLEYEGDGYRVYRLHAPGEATP
jgi:hypothetical protein